MHIHVYPYQVRYLRPPPPCVEDVFKPLPVRHKEFMRSLKREYGKLLSLLQVRRCSGASSETPRVQVESTLNTVTTKGNRGLMSGSM